MTPEALGFAQERLWEAGALDVTTERTILRNLAARYPHKTCIVTTHRPTVISLCRRVYQVSGGRMELLDNDRAQRLAMDF
jgi:ABC-type bacteriocin/lantibiotic exporter with double-glycine peptidase domain